MLTTWLQGAIDSNGVSYGHAPGRSGQVLTFRRNTVATDCPFQKYTLCGIILV